MPSKHQCYNYMYKWIEGETIRLIRTCTDKTIFTKEFNQFRKKLLRRHYPVDIVDKEMTKHSFSSRLELLSNDLTPDESPQRIFINNTPYFRDLRSTIVKTCKILDAESIKRPVAGNY